MLLMDYTSINWEYLLDYDKNAARNHFHACIESHSQIFIGEYPEDVL